MKNEFSQKTRFLFLDCPCHGCSRTVGLEAHHTLRRRNTYDNSPFNISPLCHDCHSHGDIHRFEKCIAYLTKTYHFLQSIGYKMTNKDEQFIRANWYYFEEIIYPQDIHFNKT